MKRTNVDVSSEVSPTTALSPDCKPDSEIVAGNTAASSGNGATAAAPAVAPGGDGKNAPAAPATAEKKHPLTWERTIEILKLVATIWAALLGSYVTMQYNQRQNELNRIQAIAQMLPHISAQAPSDSSAKMPGSKAAPVSSGDMSRDGAFWAIFRAANDRTMLRDLASLFPLDIYRVVSSIAIAGELDHDSDALVALRVSSEKLAAEYSNDPLHAELASRLYAQALRLRERKPDDTSPLHVVDLNGQGVGASPTGDQMTKLLSSINDLADANMKDFNEARNKVASALKGKKSSTSHIEESKQLYNRARLLGLTSDDQQVQEQVVRADLALASIYVSEQLSDDAFRQLKEAFEMESKITGKKDVSANLKKLDKDGDGYAGLNELEESIKLAEARFKQIMIDYPDKGAEIK